MFFIISEIQSTYHHVTVQPMSFVALHFEEFGGRTDDLQLDFFGDCKKKHLLQSQTISTLGEMCFHFALRMYT